MAVAEPTVEDWLRVYAPVNWLVGATVMTELLVTPDPTTVCPTASAPADTAETVMAVPEIVAVNEIGLPGIQLSTESHSVHPSPVMAVFIFVRIFVYVTSLLMTTRTLLVVYGMFVTDMHYVLVYKRMTAASAAPFEAVTSIVT